MYNKVCQKPGYCPCPKCLALARARRIKDQEQEPYAAEIAAREAKSMALCKQLNTPKPKRTGMFTPYSVYMNHHKEEAELRDIAPELKARPPRYPYKSYYEYSYFEPAHMKCEDRNSFLERTVYNSDHTYYEHLRQRELRQSELQNNLPESKVLESKVSENKILESKIPEVSEGGMFEDEKLLYWDITHE